VYCLSPDGAISFGPVPNNLSFDPRGELVEANGYLYGIADGAVFRMWLGFEPEASDFEKFSLVGSSCCGPTLGADSNLYFTGYNFDILRMSLGGLPTRIARYDDPLGAPTTPLNPAAGGGFLLGFRDYLLDVSQTGALGVPRRFDFQDGYALDALILTKRGELYGTTVYGGQNGDGTVFHVDSTGKPTALHHFDGQERFLARVRTPFVEAPDGALYALTEGFIESLVRVNATLPEPTFQTLHTFPAFDENYGPSYGEDFLFAGEDGALYGTIEPARTSDGSTRNIYRFDPRSNDLRVLASAHNLLKLFRTSAGEMYTIRWDERGYQLCHLESNGSQTVLHTFRGDAYGHHPTSNLAEGPDGALYGYATNAGFSSDIVYRWTPANGLEIYYNFPRSIATLWQNVTLIVDSSGVVYVSSIARRQEQPIQTVTNYAISTNRALKSLPASASAHVKDSDGTVFRTAPLTRSSYRGFQLVPIK